MSIGLLLSGCGAENTGKTEDQSNEQSETPKKEEKLNAEQVLTKASEASSDIKNFEMNANMDMTMEANGEAMDMKSKIFSQMTMDPILAYQKIEMSGDEQLGNMEMYMTKDEIFMYSPENDTWVKMENTAGGTLEMAQNQQSMNPGQQIEQMKQFTDNLTLTEHDKTYELNFTGKGEEMKKFAKEIALQNISSDQAEAIKQSIDQITFEDITYKYTINKETFYPEKLKMDLTMSIEENGNTVTLIQSMDATFGKYNELNDLSIPEDVKNNAEEIQLEEAGL